VAHGTRIAAKRSMAKETPSKGNQLEGEGSYTGTRRYNEHLKEHQKTHDTEELAEQARKALEGDEKAELEEAEQRGKRGPVKPSAPGTPKH
jgi:hypothetical protein